MIKSILLWIDQSLPRWLLWHPYNEQCDFSGGEGGWEAEGISVDSTSCTISHVIKEQGNGNEYLKPTESKKSSHVTGKSIQKISMFTKFECYWVKRKDIVHF